MPPAFVLSQDQTLKFDAPPQRRGNSRRQSSSFQGACLHNLQATVEAMPQRKPVTYGYVKDMQTGLNAYRAETHLECAPHASRRPHVPSSNLQCQRTRKTKTPSHPSCEGNQHPAFLNRLSGDRKGPRRCGERAYMESGFRRQPEKLRKVEADQRAGAQPERRELYAIARPGC